MHTTRKIRYVAEPKHVREVTLTGTTDLGFWSDYLKPEGLTPVPCGDAAQVWIVSAEIVYLGVCFVEVSFSVRARLTHGSRSAGMRLLYAFTSSRIFAWCERTLFATPYGYGECHVSVQSPTLIRVDAPGRCVLNAAMSPLARSAIRVGDENWEGPVFLPGRDAAGAGDGRLFFGRWSGHTVVYPFSSCDRFTMEISPGSGLLRPLADLRFLPKEWVVRTDATHGKSRTYRRTGIFAHDHVA